MTTLTSLNPATGEVLARIEEHTEAEVERRMSRAVEVFRLWRRRPIAERARLVGRAAEVLEAGKERYGKLMTQEMGKTLASAVFEAEKCAGVCRYYAENGERFLADEEVKTSAPRSYRHFQPLGPVLAVMPWNFPFWQVFRFAAPAADGGQRRSAEARLERARLRAGHRGGVPAGGVPGRRVPDPAGGFRPGGAGW